MGRSTEYYRKNKAARKRKYKTDKEINARPEQKAKRAELGRIRYAAEKRGEDIDGKDYDHATKRFVKSSVNRGRREKSRVRGSKRKKK